MTIVYGSINLTTCDEFPEFPIITVAASTDQGYTVVVLTFDHEDHSRETLQMLAGTNALAFANELRAAAQGGSNVGFVPLFRAFLRELPALSTRAINLKASSIRAVVLDVDGEPIATLLPHMADRLADLIEDASTHSTPSAGA